jgi:hypothetical protein
MGDVRSAAEADVEVVAEAAGGRVLTNGARMTTRSNPVPDSGRGTRPGIPRQPLGTVIFQKGLLTAEQLLEALDEGHRSRRRLGDILLERGWLDERALAETLAEQYGLPLVELEQEELDEEAARLIPAADSDRLGAIVIGFEDGAPVVVISDPSNTTALAELETLLGARVYFAVAAPSSVAGAIASVYFPTAEPESFPLDAEASEPGRSEPGEDASAEETAVDISPEPEPLNALGDDPGRDEADAPPAKQAPEWPFAGYEPFEPEHAPAAEAANTLPSESPATAEPESEADLVSDRGDERSDDFLWGPAPTPEPVPSGLAGAEAAAEADAAPMPEAFEQVPMALAGDEETFLADGRLRPEADTLAEPEPTQSPFGADAGLELLEAAQNVDDDRTADDWAADDQAADDWAADASAAGDGAADVHQAVDDQAADDQAADDRAADDPAPDDWVADDRAADNRAADNRAADDWAHDGTLGEAAAPVAVVLRLSNGDVVELAPFADRADAATKAAAVVEQLIADEPAGWTTIDGCYFRPQAVVAVDIVPAAS